MVHDDDTSEPVHNVIRDSDFAPVERPADLTNGRYDFIKHIVVNEPSWWARRIHEWICEERNRHDITLAMIHYVLKRERPAIRSNIARHPAARRPGTNI
ncbi:hypothetical protein EDC02_2282 [Micromonospora sp. Llam0]|uniref:hypothetical protein n=1 Tax=Micromonospora sp. Llam0 TaxID=2485143 RepID=UPI000F490B21|nr:hypothetical protein [Micromonospora sp. Llam0]ROO60416.1 hypothetical protein EDC02_2282 [Micromonospora sp. Llam0]